MTQPTPCPVCKVETAQLKRHLKDHHGWRYTAESPDFPVPVEEQQ